MVLNISLQNGKAGIIHRTGNVPAFRLFSWKPQIGLVSEMVVKGTRTFGGTSVVSPFPDTHQYITPFS